MTDPIVAVIPAKDEEERISATVTAVASIDGVSRVIVVDDGSSDDTAVLARDAGADVIRHGRNRGKAAAMTTGVKRAREVLPGDQAFGVLFVDADLADTARQVAALIPPVRCGEADLTIAILPPQARPGGGRGLVVTLARTGIEALTGWTATQPLSGMRCLSPAALQAATPFAAGWGVETGMTIDVLTAGLRVREVPCALQHRVSGTGWAGTLHRGRQYRDVWRALLSRGYRGVGR